MKSLRILAPLIIVLIPVVICNVAGSWNSTLFSNRTSSWGSGSKPMFSSTPRTTAYTTPRTTRYTTSWRERTTRQISWRYPTSTTAHPFMGWNIRNTTTTAPPKIRTTTADSSWFSWGKTTTTVRPAIWNITTSHTTHYGWKPPATTWQPPTTWNTVTPKYYPASNMEQPSGRYNTTRYPQYPPTTTIRYYPIVTHPTRPMATRIPPRTRPTIGPRPKTTTATWIKKNETKIVWNTQPIQHVGHFVNKINYPVNNEYFRVYPHQITNSYYSSNPHVQTPDGSEYKITFSLNLTNIIDFYS